MGLRRNTHKTHGDAMELSDIQRNQRRAEIMKLRAMTPEDRRLEIYTASKASLLLMRDKETLEKDRRTQRKTMAESDEKKRKIKKSSYAAVEYIPADNPGGEVEYTGEALLSFIEARIATETKPVLYRGLEPTTDPKLRGFQSWLSYASPSDVWTFCIQPDGRPLDAQEAAETKRLTADVRELNIGDFARMLTEAANKSFSAKESEVLESVSAQGKPSKVKNGPMGTKKKDKRTL